MPLYRPAASLRTLTATLMGWFCLLAPSAALAAEPHQGGEASLVLPDLSSVEVLGMSGHSLLSLGMLVALGGLAFGLVALVQIKNLPTHKSMADISAIIW